MRSEKRFSIRIKHQQARDSSMYSHFVEFISRLLMALLLLAKHKLLLLNKDRLQGVLRVDEVDGGFDEAKDMCDHFA